MGELSLFATESKLTKPFGMNSLVLLKSRAKNDSNKYIRNMTK